MKMRIAPLWLALAGVCLAWIPPAGAQMANDLTIGNPKAMALGNAVTADETGIDSVHYNPAALTRMKGRQATVKLLTGVMDIRAGFKAPPNYGEGTFGLRDDPVANSHSRTLTPTMYLPGLGGMTDVPLLVAPLAGISINPPGSKFTFATNVYTPQALGYSRDSDSDPARYQGREVSLQRLTYFSPTLAYQVNDELSVGLSVGFSHQAVALNEDFRAPNQLLGLLQQTKEIGCLPGMQEILEVFFNVCGGNIGPFQNLANIDLDMQQSLSPSFNLGVLWEPTDWFAWGATYQSESRMRLKGKYRTLDRGYRDTWSWAMGVQYDVNDRLQLRAGYEYRPSAIPKGQADILVPIGDANLYGLGLGYQWDKDTVIDVGFNYFVTKQSVKADTSCNLNCTGLDNLVYNPYAGLDVDTTVKAYIFAMTYRTTF